jgi:hypothetical protein
VFVFTTEWINRILTRKDTYMPQLKPRLLKKRAAGHHQAAMKLVRRALKQMVRERKLRAKARRLARHAS